MCPASLLRPAAHAGGHISPISVISVTISVVSVHSKGPGGLFRAPTWSQGCGGVTDTCLAMCWGCVQGVTPFPLGAMHGVCTHICFRLLCELRPDSGAARGRVGKLWPRAFQRYRFRHRRRTVTPGIAEREGHMGEEVPKSEVSKDLLRVLGTRHWSHLWNQLLLPPWSRYMKPW